MKISSFLNLSFYGLKTIIFKQHKPILGTIILTDKCNLSCKHCAVNNITSVIYPYAQIQEEMRKLFKSGVRILFFCGGETCLWCDGDKTVNDLIIEAKEIGFLFVIIVTNGTYPLDFPQADLILLSLDGDKEIHDLIRGETFDTIMRNVRSATTKKIVFYMAINQLNKEEIPKVCRIARKEDNVMAISFNFHTPYTGTEYLALSAAEKDWCCKVISTMIKEHVPVFNLQSAFPYIVHNNFPTPCYQCVVMENGELSICGRCVHIDGLCEQCGYFFAAEYALLFDGNIRVIFDMMKTYLKYI